MFLLLFRRFVPYCSIVQSFVPSRAHGSDLISDRSTSCALELPFSVADVGEEMTEEGFVKVDLAPSDTKRVFLPGLIDRGIASLEGEPSLPSSGVNDH